MPKVFIKAIIRKGKDSNKDIIFDLIQNLPYLFNMGFVNINHYMNLLNMV